MTQNLASLGHLKGQPSAQLPGTSSMYANMQLRALSKCYERFKGGHFCERVRHKVRRIDVAKDVAWWVLMNVVIEPGDTLNRSEMNAGLGGVKCRRVSRRPPRSARCCIWARGDRGHVNIEGLEPRASAARSGTEMGSEWGALDEQGTCKMRREESKTSERLSAYRARESGGTRRLESAQEHGRVRANAEIRETVVLSVVVSPGWIGWELEEATVDR
ncbi:hypothetical protein EDB83DRAFT_2552306 [Lactarius deliciosus]|nr:hypothetical protein EDB83DRAFT_2552306 [Lactarius deliciosus]